MKKKIISIVQIILMVACGLLIIYVVTGQMRKSADNTANAAVSESEELAGQQTVAAGKTDAGTDVDPEATATPEATKQPETTAAPTATPEVTKQPETTAAPTATPEVTKQPETTATPTATPETTKQPEKTTAPTATPETTKQPETMVTPTATNSPAPAHTCTWDGGSVTQAATCSSEGVKTYTCMSCGKTRTEGIAKTDHSYVTETTPATCTEYGQDRTYCSVCGYEKSRTANSDAPKGHQSYVYKMSYGGYESTCTYGGVYDVCCGICGECVERRVVVQPLGHDLQNPVVVQEASCTAVEITQFTCGRCGETIRKETADTDPNNHDWVSGIRIVDDWENGGVKEEQYFYCSRCPMQRYD